MGIINEIKEYKKQIAKNLEVISDIQSKNTYILNKYQNELFAIMTKMSKLHRNRFEWNTPENIHILITGPFVFNTKLINIIFKMSNEDIMTIKVEHEQLIKEKNKENYGFHTIGIKSSTLVVSNQTSDEIIKKYKTAFLWLLDNYISLFDEAEEIEKLEYVELIKSTYYFENQNNCFIIENIDSMIKTYYNNPAMFVETKPQTVENENLDIKTYDEVKKIFLNPNSKDLTKKALDKLITTVNNMIPNKEDKNIQFGSFFEDVITIKVGNKDYIEGVKKNFCYQDGNIKRYYSTNMYVESPEISIHLLDENKNDIFGYIYYDRRNKLHYELSLNTNIKTVNGDTIIKFVDSLKFLCNNWETITNDIFSVYLSDYQKELKNLQKEMEDIDKKLEETKKDYEERTNYYNNLF